MNKKILASMVVIGLLALGVGWGTYSYFSDTETVQNVFTAGSLDLTVNDQNGVPVTFTADNLRPGNQPHWSLTLKNIGTINGKLDISNVVVVSGENGLTEPEIEAGDASGDTGELDDVLNLRLWLDKDHSGWYSAGDVMIYNGLVKDLPSSFPIAEPINAGGDVEYIVELYDWWNTALDNQAQTDTLSITFTFLLYQA
jgi:predicted ribosomally synthesized peptide with SipW-like signal peptide